MGGAPPEPVVPDEPTAERGRLVIIEPLPPPIVPEGASRPGISLRNWTRIDLGDLQTGVLVGTSSYVYEGLDSGTGVEGSLPFVWTAASGVVPLVGSWPTDASHFYPYVLSKDGSTVAGVYNRGRAGAGGAEPVWIDSFGGFFRWTEQGGLAGLDEPESIWDAQVSHISSDGRVIVGSATGGPEEMYEPFRWSEADGFHFLSDEAGWPAGGAINDVSDDGSVLVGCGVSESPQNAFVYTQAGGVQLLGVVEGYSGCLANHVSGDGSLVIGQCYREGASENVTFRWTESEGTQLLESAPGVTLVDFSIIAASDACDVLVGRTTTAGGSSVLARWSSSTGLEPLPAVPGQSDGAVFDLFKASVSVDGSAGYGIFWPNDTLPNTDSSGAGGEALSWSHALGMRRLGFLPGDDRSAALGADQTYQLHVGRSGSELSNAAVLWDAAGIHDIAALLSAGGVDLQGIQLGSAERVAASSESIIVQGHSQNSGLSRAFIAWLPPVLGD